MTAGIEASIKAAYEDGRIYRAGTICAEADRDADDYVRRLLWEKLDMVRRHLQPGPLVDLCCASGGHLMALAPLAERAVGIDFSRPFIDKAEADRQAAGLGNVRFELGDAKALPLAEGSVGTLYSFSALYVIPGVEDVIGEIARVLRPGGRCVLDMGNSRSLNACCVARYTELPPSFHVPVSAMLAMLDRHGLTIVEHRAFQLLPLWADRPRWLWPLLHPGWKPLMAGRIGGRMVDEWLSNLPLVRHLAFRQMIVAEKKGPGG